MTTPESTTHWYLMTHLEMKRFKEWLLAENVKRLDQGEPVVEPFFPSDFIVETALSNDLSRLVFVKGSEQLIEELMDLELKRGYIIRLRRYRNTTGGWAVVSDKKMDSFINACLKHSGNIEVTPPIEGIEEMDVVRIISGPFAGCEAAVSRVQHSKGNIHLDLVINLVSGVLNVKMNHVSRNDVEILNRSASDAIRTDFIEYTQNHVLEILEHRVKGVDEPEVKQQDMLMLTRLIRYRDHQVETESARNHFLALMLICAHLVRFQEDETALKAQALEALDSISQRSESKAASDMRTYLWIALYVSTRNPVYRDAAKQYVREHQPKSQKLRQFVSLIRTGKKV